MTHYLHYSTVPNSLDDVGNAICREDMDDDTRHLLLAANPQLQQSTTKNNTTSPIIIPGAHYAPSAMPPCSPQEHKRLAALSHQVGGAATLALAELVDELKVPSFAGDLNTFGGNGVGAAAQASSFMVQDIAHYDMLLKQYHDLKNHRAVPATMMRKEVELKRAYQKMSGSLNQRGQHILHKHVSKTKEVLNAKGRVGYEPIPISSQIDVQRLATLAKVGKVAGPGFILLDGYLRYDKVAGMYEQNNASWKREAFIQTGGFAAGIAAGVFIVFVIGFAPVGLVVGIVAAGAAAVIADKAATGLISNTYDFLVY